MRRIFVCLFLIVACCLCTGVPGGRGIAEERGSFEGVFPLLERDGATATLLIAREYRLGSIALYLELSLPKETSYVWYRITDITLNGNIRLSDMHYLSGSDNPYLLKLDAGPLFALGVLKPEDIHAFSCHIRKEGLDGFLWEETCEVAVPDAFQAGFLFLPCLGARADEQVLADDGRIRITLLGLGRAAGDDRGDLAALLRAENRSDETIPFQVTGIAVNGTFFASSDNSIRTKTYTLPPNAVGYPYVTLKKENLLGRGLSDMGVTGIEDIAFMILTSEDENSGIGNRLAGGSLYPVVLSARGQQDVETGKGELLFANEWIEVYYVGREGPISSEYSYDGKDEYRWRLLIRNISDINIEIDEPYTPDALSDYHLLSTEISAGLNKTITVHFRVPAGSEPQDFSLRLVGYTAGKGKLLFTETEPIVLPLD